MQEHVMSRSLVVGLLAFLLVAAHPVAAKWIKNPSSPSGPVTLDGADYGPVAFCYDYNDARIVAGLAAKGQNLLQHERGDVISMWHYGACGVVFGGNLSTVRLVGNGPQSITEAYSPDLNANLFLVSGAVGLMMSHRAGR
jgi:hypothetical protein